MFIVSLPLFSNGRLREAENWNVLIKFDKSLSIVSKLNQISSILNVYLVDLPVVCKYCRLCNKTKFSHFALRIIRSRSANLSIFSTPSLAFFRSHCWKQGLMSRDSSPKKYFKWLKTFLHLVLHLHVEPQPRFSLRQTHRFVWHFPVQVQLCSIFGRFAFDPWLSSLEVLALVRNIFFNWRY